MILYNPNPQDKSAQKICEDHFYKISQENEVIPPWGKLWVVKGKVVVVFPFDKAEDFDVPPTIFIDETIQQDLNLFLIGGIAFKPIIIATMIATYIQTLLNIRAKYPSFWKKGTSPPRLHLKDQMHDSRRKKTAWHEVSRVEERLLIKTIIRQIRDNAGLKLFAPIHLEALRKNTQLPNIDLPDNQNDQLKISMAAIMFKSMLSNIKLDSPRIEFIADHDHTQIFVGKNKRQATLHFMDNIMKSSPEVPVNAEFIWDENARYTSRFPSEFTFDRLEITGCDLRRLVECIGLQFVDLFIGVWKLANAEKRPIMGIGSEDLGSVCICDMHWAR